MPPNEKCVRKISSDRSIREKKRGSKVTIKGVRVLERFFINTSPGGKKTQKVLNIFRKGGGAREGGSGEWGDREKTCRPNTVAGERWYLVKAYRTDVEGEKKKE